jgi:orotate phosphoribosyltransferase
VGYPDRYDGERQCVGFTYANFGAAEEHPPVVEFFSKILVGKIADRVIRADVFCGIPEGGRALAFNLAQLVFSRHILAEKDVLAMKTQLSRECSQIVFERHQPRRGDKVVIVEDECGNLCGTNEILAAVEKAGATVVAIVCFLNRSLGYDSVYPGRVGEATREIPLISVVRKPIQEYRQEEREVAAEVAAGNVVWRPKDEWGRLMAAMAAKQ